MNTNDIQPSQFYRKLLLTGMDPLVGVQRGLLGEPLQTEIALEGTFTCGVGWEIKMLALSRHNKIQSKLPVCVRICTSRYGFRQKAASQTYRSRKYN